MLSTLVGAAIPNGRMCIVPVAVRRVRYETEHAEQRMLCYMASLAAPDLILMQHLWLTWANNVRGSKFLKAWMEFLEEHADLRYPDIAQVYEDASMG